MHSPLDRYPEIYSQIISSLPPDGTPLTVTLSSNAAALRERAQLYNFFRFCRRNPKLVTHLDNRYNKITITVSGSTISFILRTSAASAELAQGVANALGHFPGALSEIDPAALSDTQSPPAYPQSPFDLIATSGPSNVIPLESPSTPPGTLPITPPSK